jgi:hypothetical protein
VIARKATRCRLGEIKSDKTDHIAAHRGSVLELA